MWWIGNVMDYFDLQSPGNKINIETYINGSGISIYFDQWLWDRTMGSMTTDE